MTIDSSAETPRLRATVRDLLALSTIPEAWVGREPPAIAADLADLLIASLGLDFAFVRLCDPTGCQAAEVTRGNSWKAFPKWLQQHLATFGQISKKEIVTNVGGVEESCCGIVIPIGVNCERGLVAGASDRPGFPDQIDQQLLSVVANSGATAFQNAFLIKELRSAQEALRANEQALRKARDELEIKVAERTAELRRSERELRDDVEKRKQAESELRRSKGHLADAQKLSRTGFVGMERSTKRIFWSEEAARIYGYPPGTEPTPDLILQRSHPEDVSLLKEVLERAAQGGNDFDFEHRLMMPDGSIKHLHDLAHCFRDEAGNEEVVGAIMDITERKVTEEAIRRSEAYLAEAQRISHTGSFGCKVSSGEMFWSEETFRIFGYDRGAKPAVEAILKRVHPDDKAMVQEQIDSATSQGKDCNLEYRLLLPDDSVKHVHVVAHAVKDKAGNLEFVGAVTDITERKAAEQRIREQEAELRQTLDFAPQLVGVYGPNRERLHVNRVTLDYLGLSLEEWRQTPEPGAFVHPDDRARDRDYFDRALSTGSAYELELRLRKGDGTYRWFLARLNPVRDDNGHIRRWYVACTDIEDRKRAEEKLQQENVALREEIDKASMFEEIVGTSSALRAVLSRISKVAPTDSTVLITGETGTGKELVARAIHRRSPRAPRAFVSVNCAAIPRDLIASELFGHEKGAFTGAVQRRIGRFELAEGGTIFLDEVGELSADTQVALLRVLQEREFERLGGRQPIHVDVRVIAATNRDLKAAVASGTFRQDLYYRLNVFPLEVPPLRERKKDIPLLVEYFIDRYARKAGRDVRSVDKKTLELLESYPWPGNIRELQNVIERSVIVSETEKFSVDESWLSQQPGDVKAGGKLYLSQKLAAKEKEIIEQALRESQGRVFGPSGAAAKLGIARSTLESKIQSLSINKDRFKANPRS
jgi:PAS domain S-box-containing protein